MSSFEHKHNVTVTREQIKEAVWEYLKKHNVDVPRDYTLATFNGNADAAVTGAQIIWITSARKE